MSQPAAGKPHVNDVAPGERVFQSLLDEETRPVPESLRATSAAWMDQVDIAPERYFDREFHRLEIERMWRRVWQMACREEQIPEVKRAFGLGERSNRDGFN